MIYNCQQLTYTVGMTARNTHQATIVVEVLNKLGHATNKQIWHEVRKQIPSVSLTTVHRVTQRLKERGVIGCTPSLSGESMLDSNPEPHSHFMCKECRFLQDFKLEAATIMSLQAQLQDALIEKCLFITGTCKQCYAQNC